MIFFRDLTEDEIKQIKDIKQKIKQERKKVQDEISKGKKFYAFDSLQKEQALAQLKQQLESIPIVVGQPVVLKLKNKIININYATLKALEKTFKDERWNVGLSIQRQRYALKDSYLIISYKHYDNDQNGIMKLKCLSLPQIEILELKLPVVELES